MHQAAKRATPRPYLLRGRLHCALCQRRLQGQWVHGEAYYRCRYPAEYAAASGFQHPKSVYLREVDLVGRLDDWLAELFSPAHLDHTCQALATTSRSDPTSHQRRAAQQVLADCQRRLDRYRAALEAGTDPTIVQQWIAEVTATRAAAEVQLRDSHTAPEGLTPEQVRGLLEQVGGLVDTLDRSDPALHAQLYEELGIDGVYDPTAAPWTSTRSSVGVLVVSEGRFDRHVHAGTVGRARASRFVRQSPSLSVCECSRHCDEDDAEYAFVTGGRWL